MVTRAASPRALGEVRRILGDGPDRLAAVRQRAAALVRLAHPSVLAPAAVELDAHGQVVATLPRVAGMDLAELARCRQALNLGECVWLGLRVGEALTAMHGARMVHGDVAPANVTVADGVVTLVDTLSGAVETELGTAGFRAPERTEGASAAGDVYSWGMLLRWCANEQARARVEAWTAPMVSVSPGARPPAHVAVRALRTCGEPVAVVVPVVEDVVAASRSRAIERTERIAEGRGWRVRRGAARGAGAVAVAACAMGIIAGVPAAVDAVLPPESPAPGEARSLRADPALAARELTITRAAALEVEDASALRAVPALDAVRAELVAMAGRIEEGALAFDGLEITAVEAHTVHVAGDGAIVELDYAVSAHSVTDGAQTFTMPALQQRATMALAWEDGWAVASVSPRE